MSEVCYVILAERGSVNECYLGFTTGRAHARRDLAGLRARSRRRRAHDRCRAARHGRGHRRRAHRLGRRSRGPNRRRGGLFAHLFEVRLLHHIGRIHHLGDRLFPFGVPIVGPAGVSILTYQPA